MRLKCIGALINKWINEQHSLGALTHSHTIQTKWASKIFLDRIDLQFNTIRDNAELWSDSNSDEAFLKMQNIFKCTNLSPVAKQNPTFEKDSDPLMTSVFESWKGKKMRNRVRKMKVPSSTDSMEGKSPLERRQRMAACHAPTGRA